MVSTTTGNAQSAFNAPFRSDSTNKLFALLHYCIDLPDSWPSGSCHLGTTCNSGSTVWPRFVGANTGRKVKMCNAMHKLHSNLKLNVRNTADQLSMITKPCLICQILNPYNILSMSIFCKISLSILIFSKISFLILIQKSLESSVSVSIFSKMTLSISIFFENHLNNKDINIF